jgi:hypothetical protein
MAEAVLRLGHADRQLVKAHGSEALQANMPAQHSFVSLGPFLLITILQLLH